MVQWRRPRRAYAGLAETIGLFEDRRREEDIERPAVDLLRDEIAGGRCKPARSRPADQLTLGQADDQLARRQAHGGGP
jgi:hypothetical protein